MEYNLKDWFKEFSFDTWERVKLSSVTTSIRTSEVTLTENLIYSFYLLSKQFDLPIQIFEAKNEAINGNDIEFAIEMKEGYILLPTQAKILKKNRKYSTISHKVKGQSQIDLLEKYARKVHGIPLYLLYNGFYVFEDEFGLDNLEFYGCSLAPLKDLKSFRKGNRWKIPNFSDIHPNLGIPFYVILNLLGKRLDDNPFHNTAASFEHDSLRFYSEKEVIDNFNGTNLAPRPRIGYVPSGNQKENNVLDKVFYKENKYQPKFRVVISNNPRFNKFQIREIGYKNSKPIEVED